MTFALGLLSGALIVALIHIHGLTKERDAWKRIATEAQRMRAHGASLHESLVRSRPDYTK